MPFSPIPEILEELKAGKPIVLVDDEDRENEGDIVYAAEKVTPGGDQLHAEARPRRGLPVADRRDAATSCICIRRCRSNTAQLGRRSP